MRLSINSTSPAVLGTLMLGTALLAACASTPTAKAGYHLGNKYTIGGDAGWDYLAIDPDARRVYVTHYTKIEVIDADTGKVVGQITDTPGVHGIALVKSIGKGFTSNGKADTVSVIDLKTNAHLAEIKVGKKPDAITYDPGTER
jgi:YVTN family beta-propeller protein